MLFKALHEGDQMLLGAVARLAVARFSGMEAGRPVGGTYYLYRTLRNLDLDGVLSRLVAEARALAGGAAMSEDTDDQSQAGTGADEADAQVSSPLWRSDCSRTSTAPASTS